jgi:hypothetical protein
MAVFLLMAAVVGSACWILGGVGYGTRMIAHDTCSMMSRHLAGDLNPWVLEQARCKELENVYESIGPLMQSSNYKVEEANKGLSRAFLPLVLPNSS